MKDRFLYSIRSELKERFNPGDRLILALSGGPDSMALFRALVELKPDLHFELHVAHVDHGWREESLEEAKLLKKWVEESGVTFHSIRVFFEGAHNLEDRARRARGEFFERLYDELQAKALLLGHHKDDLAETVLKRLFEGAHLENLGGMEKGCLQKERLYLRPLLDFEKGEIVEWLEGRWESYFIDKTNSDPKFLRTRLRKTLIPRLEAEFGKNIKHNLTLLSKRSFFLKEHLDQKIAPWKRTFKEMENGYSYQIQGDRLEIEHFFLWLSSRHEIKISAPECETLTLALLENRGIRVERKEGTWIVSKGQIFIERKTKSCDSGKVNLKI